MSTNQVPATRRIVKGILSNSRREDAGQELVGLRRRLQSAGIDRINGQPLAACNATVMKRRLARRSLRSSPPPQSWAWVHNLTRGEALERLRDAGWKGSASGMSAIALRDKLIERLMEPATT